MNKRGWIVYNASLGEGKFLDLATWFNETALSYGMETKLVKNSDLLITISNGKATLEGKYKNEKPDFILFWDKDIRLAYHLEKMGFRLFNCARAIEICDDKGLTYQMLSDANVAMPKTIIAPKIFEGCLPLSAEMLLEVEKALSYPIVIKEVFGSFGNQVYLANNFSELQTVVSEIKDRPFLFQELIKTSYGKDLRIQVVGEQVVATMLRKSEHDFRACITHGGSSSNFTPSQAQIDFAVHVTKTLGLDFAGIDVMFGEHDEPILCEVNSNAHIKNLFEATGVDVTKHIIEYISKQLS